MEKASSLKKSDEISSASVADRMLEIAKEVEQVINKSKETAKLEVAREAERVLDQFKHTADEIRLRFAEEVKSEAVEIANHAKEAIMEHFETTSSQAIASEIAEVSRVFEKSLKDRQEMDLKVEQPPATTQGEVKDAAGGVIDINAQDEVVSGDKAVEIEIIPDDNLEEGGGVLDQGKDFDKWLSR